jgi:hypothetical protein
VPVELTSPWQFATRDFGIKAFGDASCDVDAALRNTGDLYVVVPVDDGRRKSTASSAMTNAVVPM